MKYEYPALFYDDDNQVAFHFYDCEEWFLCGENIFSAIEMAQDVLNEALLTLERAGKEIPKATPLSEVEVKPLQVVKMIEADTDKYAKELAAQNEREQILNAANPIRELLNLRGMKIKELADALGAPYRTCQDWALGKSKPPAWSLNLILDKLIG